MYNRTLVGFRQATVGLSPFTVSAIAKVALKILQINVFSIVNTFDTGISNRLLAESKWIPPRTMYIRGY